MKRLFVIEGFDRAGKDTLLQDLNNLNLSNTYIYFNDLEGLPKYDKEQNSFLEWLNKFILTQIKQLNDFLKRYDTVIMTRLYISDEVYSNLFNREHTTINYLPLLRDDVEIYNYCILFKNYQEYIKRIELLINDNEPIQYDENNFNKINKLYKDIINKTNNSYINFINHNTSKKDILNNFLNFLNNDNK